MLAKQTGMTEADVSRCLKDESAKELQLFVEDSPGSGSNHAIQTITKIKLRASIDKNFTLVDYV